MSLFFTRHRTRPARAAPARSEALVVPALLCAALLFATGCATRQIARPSPPPKQAQKEEPRKPEPAPLRHLAPPPAYGNKIVLAESGTAEPSL